MSFKRKIFTAEGSLQKSDVQLDIYHTADSNSPTMRRYSQAPATVGNVPPTLCLAERIAHSSAWAWGQSTTPHRHLRGRDPTLDKFHAKMVLHKADDDSGRNASGLR